MAPAAKKTNKTVSFTPEPEDQSLLQAVTEILDRQEYSNFSDLCKDALEQFLAGPPPGVEGLEPVLQQMAQLQHQVVALEQAISNQDTSSLSQLEGQLIQISQQVEQGDSEVLQLLAQLQEQGSGSGGSFPDHLTDQIDQIDEQVSQLARQSDGRVTEAIAELQQQFADLEQNLLASVGAGSSGGNLDEQVSFLAEQVEQLDARTYDALTELKQALQGLQEGGSTAGSEAGASDTTKLEAYLKRLTDQLIKRVDQVETKTGDRITALQQQFTQLTETLAERQEKHFNQLTEHLNQQLETLQATASVTSAAPEPAPKVQQGQPFAATAETEEEDEPPARPGEPADSELLSRFGSLLGNGF